MSGVDGGSLPAQAWTAFMTAAHREIPAHDFPVPADVKLVTLCADSHQLALPTCPHRLQEYLPLASIPTQVCAKHFWVTRRICVESGKLATPRCPVTEMRTFAYNAVPTEYCPLEHEHTPVPAAETTPTAPAPGATPTPENQHHGQKAQATPNPANQHHKMETHATPAPTKPGVHAKTPSNGQATVTHPGTRATQHAHHVAAPTTTRSTVTPRVTHHAQTKRHHPATATMPSGTGKPKSTLHPAHPHQVTPAPPAATDATGGRAKQVPDEKIERYSPE